MDWYRAVLMVNIEPEPQRQMVLDRRFDYVLCVLESLPVGRGGTRNSEQWELPRAVNSMVYPSGPNVLFRMVQDRPYPGVCWNGEMEGI
jgi:hypothetical protein